MADSAEKILYFSYACLHFVSAEKILYFSYACLHFVSAEKILYFSYACLHFVSAGIRTTKLAASSLSGSNVAGPRVARGSSGYEPDNLLLVHPAKMDNDKILHEFTAKSNNAKNTLILAKSAQTRQTLLWLGYDLF